MVAQDPIGERSVAPWLATRQETGNSCLRAGCDSNSCRSPLLIAIAVGHTSSVLPRWGGKGETPLRGRAFSVARSDVVGTSNLSFAPGTLLRLSTEPSGSSDSGGGTAPEGSEGEVGATARADRQRHRRRGVQRPRSAPTEIPSGTAVWGSRLCHASLHLQRKRLLLSAQGGCEATPAGQEGRDPPFDPDALPRAAWDEFDRRPGPGIEDPRSATSAPLPLSGHISWQITSRKILAPFVTVTVFREA